MILSGGITDAGITSVREEVAKRYDTGRENVSLNVVMMLAVLKTFDALAAENERLRADIKAAQDLILFLPLPDEPDRYRALTQLRAECYRITKLIRIE